MVIADRRIALAYRLVAVALIATGLGRSTGLFAGAPTIEPFRFFTTQSNALCLVWVAILLVRTALDLRRSGARGWSSSSPRFHGVVMMAITVTMLIYLVVLVPQPAPGYEPFTLTDDLLHIVTPSLVILDWLLFQPKGRFRWFDPPIWAAIPYAYLVFAFAYGAAGGDFGGGTRVPYPFMDVSTLGVGGVALWIVALTVALEVVGYVYIAVDRGLGRLSRRTSPSRAETVLSVAP